MPLNLSLLLPTAYIKDVTNQIDHAKTRICLITMVIGDDSSTNQVIDALIKAAERGVKVEVAADIFTYIQHGGIILPTRHKSKSSRQTTLMAKRLIKSGVKFSWLGRSHTTVFSGRTHIKWCIVDDTIYAFGGVNLYRKGVDNSDYMIKTSDKNLANKLIAEYKRLVAADADVRVYRSHSFKTGDDEVLIDGGIIGDSIIYRRACQLAAKASRISFVSQYCPTGKLSKLLKNNDSKLYFNPTKSTAGLNKLLTYGSVFLTKNHSLYNKQKYLHAKFMLFEMEDGQKIVLTGSHNFVDAGVLLGTREIALQTKNPLIIQQLEDFLSNLAA